MNQPFISKLKHVYYFIQKNEAALPYLNRERYKFVFQRFVCCFERGGPSLTSRGKKKVPLANRDLGFAIADLSFRPASGKNLISCHTAHVILDLKFDNNQQVAVQ